MKPLLLLPLAAAAALIIISPAHSQVLKGLWEFDDDTNLGKASFGTDLTIEGSAPTWSASATYNGTTLNGVITTVQGVANRLRATHHIGANGGNATRSAEYTLVYDVRRPTGNLWRTFYQTDLNNTSDAEYFTRGGGGTVNSLGRTTITYTSFAMPEDQWLRLVISVRLGSNFVTYMTSATGVTQSHNHSALTAANGEYSLDPAEVLLFADNTASETNPLTVGLVAIYDGALNAAQVAALGLPGTPIPLPPAAVQWTGAQSSAWTTTPVDGLSNWVLQSDGITPAEFQNGSPARFTASAGNFNVTVDAEGVSPASMAFEDDGVNYTLTGGTIRGGGGLSKQGDGTLTLDLEGTFGGPTSVEDGVLRVANPLALAGSTVSGTFNLSEIVFGAITAATFGGLAGDADLLLASSEATPQPIAFTVGGNGTTTSYSGELSGPGSLAKNGAGMLTLNLGSPFSGGTTINGGTIRMQDPAALGSGAIAHNGGQVRFSFGNGSDAEVANDFILRSTGHQTFVIRGSNDGAPTLPTTVTLSGKITGGAAGEIYRLLDTTTTQNHNNVLRLTNAASDFQGSIEMWRGTLAITSDDALGHADNDIIHYTENINGSIRFDAADITLNPNRTITMPRSGTAPRPIDTNGFNARIEGPLTSSGEAGAVELVKKSAGTLTLAGATPFGGSVRIDAGTLALEGEAQLDSVTGINIAAGSTLDISAVQAGFILNTGRILRGNGTVAGHLKAAGTIAPGAAANTLGTLTLANGLALANGTVQLEIDSRTAQSDRLVVTGDIALQAGGILAINDLAGLDGETLAPGTKIALIEYTGTINGLLAINNEPDVADGATVTIGDNTFVLAYADTTDGVNPGKFLTLTVPGTPVGGFAGWAATNAPGQTINDDHDNDGAANGIEFFMGESGNGFTALPGIVNGKVSWPRGISYTGVYGTDYVVQRSTDLVGWTDVPLAGVNDGSPLEYTLPAGPKLFIRLKVTGP
jgi:autotransporter-associated beta strand protein